MHGNASKYEPLTYQQTITLQALHQEQLARLTCLSLPKLSTQHSKAFLQLASNSLNIDPSKAPELLRFRKSLWGHQEEGRDEPVSVAKMTPKAGTSQVLPEWYDLHNARCSRCYLPLVRGVNSLHAQGKSAPHDKRRSVSQKKEPKSICKLCQPKAAARVKKSRSIRPSK